jgi:serine/threonine protein kinase
MSETVALTQGLPSHIGPGVVIGGKYRLEAEIGRGSMGTVYRAVHVTLGQRVAIKLISTEHSQSVEARKRFSVEAKAAAKLRSRHVVQVYDDGETPEGNPYIVLEYLDGETLEQRLDREHDVPLADAVRIVSHVGRALARAHAHGIVHRDLKPANIFLVKTDDDETGWIAKVLDFGIAKLDGAGEKGTTQAGTVLGTPLFMSPEQVRGASSVDHRADLYSLGMCLFHMLTSEYAFYSPNYSDTLIGICTLPLPHLREKAPWVSESVEQWFQRACAKEPLERFQSADEMTEALRAAAGSMPLSKHQSSPDGRIAPETLVGYAAPALATLQLDASPLSLARTQAVQQPRTTEGDSPGPAVVIAVTGDERTITGGASEWQPPRSDFRPLVVGIGLGLLAVSALVVTLLLMGDGDDKPKASEAAQASASAIAPKPPPASILAPVAPEIPADAADNGSSTAAESALAPAAAVPNGKLSSPKKSPASAATRPKQAGIAVPAPPRAGGSDLGF